MLTLVAAFVITASLLLSACTQNQPAPHPEQNSGQQNYGAHQLNFVGSTLTVMLEENMTTGYEWSCPTQIDSIKMVSDAYIPDETKPGADGSGGTRVFEFETLKEGTAVLEFDCIFQGDPKQAAEHMSISVEIDGEGSIVKATFVGH